MSELNKKIRGSEGGRESLRSHKKRGKTLIPPILAAVPDMNLRSWNNTRLPEMLWACLVITVLPRRDALTVLRTVAKIGGKFRDHRSPPKWTLFHSHLAENSEELIEHIVGVVRSHPLGSAALRPMLLLESLPARERWAKAIDASPADDDWNILSEAVGRTLHHQSEETTDVKWVTLLFQIARGIIRFSQKVEERVMTILEYPDRGDPKSVMPAIRAMEEGLSGQLLDGTGKWAADFWDECYQKTECKPDFMPRFPIIVYNVEECGRAVLEVHNKLLEHWFATATLTSTDPRHDAAFGLGFYSLACLVEMLSANAAGIAGRLLLRTIVETRISLAYLKSKDTADLWAKFRDFGRGQAKLAKLKLEDLPESQRGFISPQALEELAGEDLGENFVKIDLGHWCGSDLRKMSEEAGVKDDYDRVYGWTSTFAHGHWPAIRETCMTTCFNPLHRLHKIPLPGHRRQEDSVGVAVDIVNSVLNDLGALFSPFVARIAISGSPFDPNQPADSPSEAEGKPGGP